MAGARAVLEERDPSLRSGTKPINSGLDCKVQKLAMANPHTSVKARKHGVPNKMSSARVERGDHSAGASRSRVMPIPRGNR
jgi:hypothetical protein